MANPFLIHHAKQFSEISNYFFISKERQLKWNKIGSNKKGESHFNLQSSKRANESEKKLALGVRSFVGCAKKVCKNELRFSSDVLFQLVHINRQNGKNSSSSGFNPFCTADIKNFCCKRQKNSCLQKRWKLHCGFGYLNCSLIITNQLKDYSALNRYLIQIKKMNENISVGLQS